MFGRQRDIVPRGGEIGRAAIPRIDHRGAFTAGDHVHQQPGAGKRVAGSGQLRKQLKDDAVVDAILKLMGSESVSVIMEYNDRYSTVMLGSKFRIADLSTTPYRFYGRDDFLAFKEADSYENEDGKRVSKARVWLSHPSRRAYDRVAFMPGGDDENTLNLWPGFSTTPDSTAKCGAWVKLTRDVICGDEAEFNWVMNWLASIIREPSNPARTALAVIGVQGAGKSLWLQYFGKILGGSYVVVTDDKHIHGSFNAHLATALLLHSEEALFAGDHRHRGIIKSLVTDAKRMVEHKGVDAYQVDNFLRLALLSNDSRVAPAERDDRRFTIIDMKTNRRMASRELVTQIVAEMKSTGPAALHHYFMNVWPYDPSAISTNIKNEVLREVKELNLDAFEQWWSDVLHNGQPLPDTLMWATRSMSEFDEWPEYVGLGALYANMVQYLRSRSLRHIPSSTEFGMKLKQLMPGLPYYRTKRRFVKPMDDELPPYARELSETQNVLKLPDLKDCRAAFETYIGSSVEWPGELPDDEKAAWQKKAELRKEKPSY